MTTNYQTALRDRIAHRLASWVLDTIATREYRDFVAGATEYGMRAAARDLDEGREEPPDWRTRG